MKKTVFFLGVSLSMAIGAAHAADVDCAGLSRYQVVKTSFSKLPVDEALAKITQGTPLKVVMEEKTGKTVTASDIEGPLDDVMSTLAKNAKFAFKQDGCILNITSEKVLPTWQVKQGESVMNTLSAWAASTGWQLVWDVKKDFAFGSSSQITGEFEDAITELINIINTDARGLRAVLYAGNNVLRVSTNIEGGVSN